MQIFMEAGMPLRRASDIIDNARIGDVDRSTALTVVRLQFFRGENFFVSQVEMRIDHLDLSSELCAHCHRDLLARVRPSIDLTIRPERQRDFSRNADRNRFRIALQSRSDVG